MNPDLFLVVEYQSGTVRNPLIHIAKQVCIIAENLSAFLFSPNKTQLNCSHSNVYLIIGK